jgi:NAD(P)-dependent dehydrogenase (short-subunit alcohol dehydrogenase family)
VNEKVVLITGSSSGFGRLLVTAFLDSGYRVIGTLRNVRRSAEIFRVELNDHAGRFFPLALDVTSEKERASALEFIERNFAGRLDCLINNAGFGLFGALEDLSEAQIREQMEVNFFGTALLTRQLLPVLRQSRGRVINISSVLGYSAMPLSSMYCAGKFAVEGLSEALYHELKPHGVQVAVVEPGGFRTNFANNQQWGERSFEDHSPYRKQSGGLHRFRLKRASGPGNPPAPVIEAVMRLAAMKEMPLRVRCGKDARMVFWLRRLLPERLQMALFSEVYRRMFRG